MHGGASLYASATALAFVRQAVKKEATYFLRFFDYGTSKLIRVENDKEALEAEKLLLKHPYSGGGTSINNAIAVAINDIKKEPKKFEKVELMLISDGEDSVSIGKKDLGEIKLNSTIIGQINQTLKDLSETYSQVSINDIIRQFNLDKSNFNQFY